MERAGVDRSCVCRSRDQARELHPASQGGVQTSLVGRSFPRTSLENRDLQRSRCVQRRRRLVGRPLVIEDDRVCRDEEMSEG